MSAKKVCNTGLKYFPLGACLSSMSRELTHFTLSFLSLSLSLPLSLFPLCLFLACPYFMLCRSYAPIRRCIPFSHGPIQSNSSDAPWLPYIHTHNRRLQCTPYIPKRLLLPGWLANDDMNRILAESYRIRIKSTTHYNENAV